MLRYHGGESSIPYVISAPRNGLFDSSLFCVSGFGWKGNNQIIIVELIIGSNFVD